MPDAVWIERTEGSALGGVAAAFIAEAGAGWVGFVMARLDHDDPTLRRHVWPVGRSRRLGQPASAGP
jgi:hypothetical protein